FKLFFRRRVARVSVRMMLHRELAISSLQLLIGGGTADAQDFVVIAFFFSIHGHYLWGLRATRTMAGRSKRSLNLYPVCNSSSTWLSSTSADSTISMASCTCGLKGSP